jgi:hypothetical protein
MVRFSDLLGRGDDDDESRRHDDEARGVAPTEPVPPPPTEPPPPPPPASSNEMLDQLTQYSSAPAPPAAPTAPEPLPQRSRFGLPPELLKDVPREMSPPHVAAERSLVDSLVPVDDDLLPRRRGK